MQNSVLLRVFLCLYALISIPAVEAIESTSPPIALSSSLKKHLSWHSVVEYAKTTLPQEGVLIQKSDGFVYLKVDDQYIHALLPLLNLQSQGFKEPPYFRKNDSPGAHISVFYSDEIEHPLKEKGRFFPFELKNIVIVSPRRGIQYAVLQVESPALEQLRKKYGKPSKLHGHEFHITLGKKSHH